MRTTRRWAVAVLTLATVALAAYLALVVVAVWLFGSSMEVLADRDLGALDLRGLFVDVVPGLLVGWGAGFAATVVLGRGEALTARGAGIVSGSLGVVAGAAVLAATGIL